MQDGYSAEALHGELSQSQRDAVMRKFRQKNVQILVATDVAARGIDVDDITHVIHYKLSDEIAAYTHRSGRTARAGKSGVSIALINMHERRRIQDLERRNNIKISLEKIPDGKAICENQLIALLNKVIESPVNEKEIEDYLPLAYEALCQLDKKEIIKRFVSVEFNHFLEYYRHAGDINVKPKSNDSRSRDRGPRSDNRSRGPRTESSDAKRFSINMGRANKINAGAIVRIICENCKIASSQVGEISLGHDQSFFDIKKDSANAVREGMQNVNLDGRKVSVRAATPQGGGGGPRQRSGRQGHPGGRRRN